MIAAELLKSCASTFDLLRILGYEVRPIAIVAAEWRRAGIDIAWPDALPLHLATRVPGADIYALDGLAEPAEVARFLKSLQSYNVLVKPVLISLTPRRLLIYDLSPRRELRRLETDLENPARHALDRLNLLNAAGATEVAKVFDRALDRDALTRQFFDRFRSSVINVATALRQQFPDESRDAVAGEALLILSRLLFLYFVQQKGWLNGERRFLADRLDRALRARDGFFASVLLPLFFGCLNTPGIERNASARAFGVIPYLNGGLFEPSAFERRHPDIDLSDELMQSIIDKTFERFAFSVDERDESGMHVDPEMLGKVFESLMAEDERAASGSFYTPRAIVDVLTARAIEQWHAAGDINTVGREQARQLMARLERITVLDPACGSGAFLLSALSVIERLFAQLSTIAELPAPSRQRIIERSLYGVDLKPEAVRLCELRLWLAIVAQARMPIDAVPPLPNLDRNILQGNSLLSPTDFLGDARGDVYREWRYAILAHADIALRYRNAPQHERPALARLLRASDCRLATELLAMSIDRDEAELRELSRPERDLFGEQRPTNSGKCHELQKRIRDSRRMLERVEQGELDFFSFDVHFAHVMSAGGFDIVAGNPPWVRNSRIDFRSKRMYVDRYELFRGRRAAAFHQPDLSVVFFERALSLAAPDGVVSLLMPAKIMNAAYATPLRRAAEKHEILALQDWSDGARRLFDADTFPLTITVRRSRKAAHSNVDVTCGGESFRVPQQSLSWSGSEWSLLPPDIHAIIARLRAEHAALASVLGRTPVMGVKTGDNGSFFIDVTRLRGDIAETTDGVNIPLRYLCRCVRGRDLRDGELTDAAWMLWPPAGGWLRIPKWLERFAEIRGVDPDDLHLRYVRPEHLGIKVVWKDVSRGLAPATLRARTEGIPLIPNQTLYALAANSGAEARALTIVLGSTIFNALAISIAERAKDFHYRYFGRTIARLPLPAMWSTAADVNDVPAMYGVTPAEHTRLEAFLRRRLGHVADAD